MKKVILLGILLMSSITYAQIYKSDTINYFQYVDVDSDDLDETEYFRIDKVVYIEFDIKNNKIYYRDIVDKIHDEFKITESYYDEEDFGSVLYYTEDEDIYFAITPDIIAMTYKREFKGEVNKYLMTFKIK